MTQKKQDWRAEIFIDEIWGEQGFDTTVNENLTYTELPSNGYSDIPISLNSKYFPMFHSFELILPEDRRLPMEFE